MIMENQEPIRGPMKTESIHMLIDRQPTKHLEVCAAYFPDENYRNRLVDLADNSGSHLEQRLKSAVVHKGHVSFAT